MAETRKRIATAIDDLPTELLHLIFRHLHDSDLKPLSLVSKQFYSLSNSILRKLTLTDSSASSDSNFQRLFRRFPYVKKIHVSIRTIDSALVAISNSSLALEKLQLWMFEYPTAAEYPGSETMSNISASVAIRSIKSLQIGWFVATPAPWKRKVGARQMIDFIHLFPMINELDFRYSFYWRDEGIERVTSKLPNLRRIVLRGNYRLTDRTLTVLSSNCPNLESVNFEGCDKFTLDALHTYFCRNSGLSSVDMPRLRRASISKMVECVEVVKFVSHFSFGYACAEDAVLEALVKSAPPLKSLTLEYTFSPKYSMEGVSAMLSAFPLLERLVIDLPYSTDVKTQDMKLSRVVGKLPCLKRISVQSRYICQTTLFSLVQNCPLLETIRLARDPDPAKNQIFIHDTARPTKKNYNIRSIEIRPRDCSSSIWLRAAVEPYCPNLNK